MRNVVNRFVYTDERSDFDNINEEMEEFINNNNHKIPELLLNVILLF